MELVPKESFPSSSHLQLRWLGILPFSSCKGISFISLILPTFIYQILPKSITWVSLTYWLILEPCWQQVEYAYKVMKCLFSKRVKNFSRTVSPLKFLGLTIRAISKRWDSKRGKMHLYIIQLRYYKYSQRLGNNQHGLGRSSTTMSLIWEKKERRGLTWLLGLAVGTICWD